MAEDDKNSNQQSGNGEQVESPETDMNESTEVDVSVDGNESGAGAELANHLQRALADYDNLKKEMVRREAEWAKYAAGGLIEQLIPVMESWRIAAATRPQPDESGQLDGESCRKWMDGVGHVRQQLSEVLRKAGVTFIDEANVPLDLTVHEAVLVEPREDVESDTVLEVMEPGVKLHDRVIKPAKVKVAT